MGKLFILLNALPAFLTAVGLFTYYIVIDGTCSKYPDIYPKLCPLLGHIHHSVEKPEMTALKPGDSFPEGVEFRYALHATPTIPVHLLNLLFAVGCHIQKRKVHLHPAAYPRSTMPAKNSRIRR